MQHEIPDFEIEQLIQYNGENPFILEIKEKYINNKRYSLTSFENEYLLNNFKYCGYAFPRMQVFVGALTEKRIQSEFKQDRKIPHVFIDTLVGETKEWYHVSCRAASGRTYFWLYKAEIGNLFEMVFTYCSKVDFDALNQRFNGKNLLKHQEKSVDFLLYHKRCFLLDTAGNGKTYSSIAAALAGDCKKILVVCLSGLKKNWYLEIQEWNETAKIISGEKSWNYTDTKFTIINFDILPNYYQLKKDKKTNKLYRPLLEEQYDCIIIDEIQKIRKTTSQRSQVLAALCASNSVKYVWGLSGTPIAKNEEFLNLCINLNISVSDLIFTPKDYHYLEYSVKNEEFIVRYCHGFKVIPKDGKKPFWIKGKKINGIMQHNSNTYELHQRCKHLQLRRHTQNSIEGFPEKTRDKLWVSFTSKEKQEYDELFENYMNVKRLNDEVDDLYKDCMKELKDIFKSNKYYDFERLIFKYLSRFNSIKDQASKFIAGHVNMVKSHVEQTLDRIENIIENYNNHIKHCEKLEKEEKIDEITSFDVKIPKDIEKNREIIETLLLRQYLAIKKVPHTIKFIKDEIEDGNNFIIFTHFIEEFELLVEGLKEYANFVKSGWTTEKKQHAIDNFMQNSDIKGIIGNITTLGTGFNITKADVVMFNSPNWDGGDHEQAEKRAWRIGRKDLVRCYYHIFDDSIEEKVFEVAESKKANSEIFLGDEKSEHL